MTFFGTSFGLSLISNQSYGIDKFELLPAVLEVLDNGIKTDGAEN